MQVWGAFSNQISGDTAISPYGTFGSTGTGGVGTYGLVNNQPTTTTFTAAGTIGAHADHGKRDEDVSAARRRRRYQRDRLCGGHDHHIFRDRDRRVWNLQHQ